MPVEIRVNLIYLFTVLQAKYENLNPLYALGIVIARPEAYQGELKLQENQAAF